MENLSFVDDDKQQTEGSCAKRLTRLREKPRTIYLQTIWEIFENYGTILQRLPPRKHPVPSSSSSQAASATTEATYYTCMTDYPAQLIVRPHQWIRWS